MNDELMMMEPEQFAGVPAIEQETTITYCRTLPIVEIWTNDRTVMTKFDKLVKESPEFYKLKEIGLDRAGHLLCKTYILRDKSMMSFRSKKRTMNLSDEEKAEWAARFKTS